MAYFASISISFYFTSWSVHSTYLITVIFLTHLNCKHLKYLCLTYQKSSQNVLGEGTIYAFMVILYNLEFVISLHF